MRFRVCVAGLCVPCLLAMTFLSGCGSGVKNRPKLAKVKGVVKYKGEPVTDAAVSFMMDGAPRAAVGRTDSSGRFQLTTFDTNDGAPIGTHKVTVAKVAAPTAPMTPADLAKNGPPKPPKGMIPVKYSDSLKTPLQYTIEEGSNEKEIVLED
ncbi:MULTISPECIES: carboxypeptidase-like regulatory domain-containing protein [unclassified Schlesneria]|uniref:carboxypeptidase-like regulatory domain-containing protein n=1 Tax=Schlesneria TaxID=656899 RepID=UPI002EFFDB5D